MKRIAIFALAGVLCNCTQISYDTLQPGRFSGTVFVMWVGEGGGPGDGKFLFVPDPAAPLTFTRAGGQVFKPGMMYTDGGSIPRVAQLFKGFQPWGYAPAYMIHDWLYVAKHCINDRDPNPRYDTVRPLAFAESAEVLGEAILALVQSNQVSRDDLAGTAITAAVGSPFSKASWQAEGRCEAEKVSASDAARAEAAIPGSSTAAFRRSFNLAAPVAPAPPGQRARLVATVSF